MARLRIVSLLFTLGIGAGCANSGSHATVTITSPTAGEAVTLGSDAMKSVPISFSVTRFGLEPPGTVNCPIESCGFVELFIDGVSCTEAGMFSNSSGDSSPINAQFALCPSPTGSHTVRLELHNFDSSAVTDLNGGVVADSVVVLAR